MKEITDYQEDDEVEVEPLIPMEVKKDDLAFTQKEIDAIEQHDATDGDDPAPMLPFSAKRERFQPDRKYAPDEDEDEPEPEPMIPLNI